MGNPHFGNKAAEWRTLWMRRKQAQKWRLV